MSSKSGLIHNNETDFEIYSSLPKEIGNGSMIEINLRHGRLNGGSKAICRSMVVLVYFGACLLFYFCFVYPSSLG